MAISGIEPTFAISEDLKRFLNEEGIHLGEPETISSLERDKSFSENRFLKNRYIVSCFSSSPAIQDTWRCVLGRMVEGGLVEKKLDETSRLLIRSSGPITIEIKKEEVDKVITVFYHTVYKEAVRLAAQAAQVVEPHHCCSIM